MPAAAPEQVVSPVYQIDQDGEDLVIRIPRSVVTRDGLERFLDWIQFEHLKSRSHLTEEDAAELAREVKHAVHVANLHRAQGT